ncbi:MAG: MoxR family ATPase [bacterium]|nr:MoxR family ATPase [bacterium]
MMNQSISIDAAYCKDASDRIAANIEKVVIGKHDTVMTAVCALFCEGHMLLEDVPGVGKTLLAKALGASLGFSCGRIQCTSDLLPSDVLGVNIYNRKIEDFVFRPGPVNNNIVLIDEINRANPKTQSALLECMEERQVTSDGVSMRLPRPFMIIATQNPIEYDGTFPLPEAQLDRFFVRASLGYPDLDSEFLILDQKEGEKSESLMPADPLPDLRAIQKFTENVFVSDSVKNYILEIVRSTRKDSSVFLGASPRASIALQRAARAFAVMNGRNYVTPDDVKKAAHPVLDHRIRMAYGGRGNNPASVFTDKILASVSVPV